MVNTTYQFLKTLREKSAATSAGITAPTTQPIKPVEVHSSMPGAGPLSSSTTATIGANAASGASTTQTQPAGFVAGMQQSDQMAMEEQAKAMEEQAGQAQKAQQDVLNEQYKSQQNQLKSQADTQKALMDKDMELQKMQIQMKSMEEAQKARESASALTPGVSQLIPTKAKSIASKAQSLLKKGSTLDAAITMVAVRRLMQFQKDAKFMAKRAIDYGQVLDGHNKTQSPVTQPTSVVKGLTNPNTANPKSLVTPSTPAAPAAPTFQYKVQNGKQMALGPDGYSAQMPSMLTPMGDIQNPQNAYATHAYNNSRLAGKTPTQVPLANEMQMFATGTNPDGTIKYEAFTPEGYKVDVSGKYTDPAAAQTAARQQFLKQYGSGVQGYNYAAPQTTTPRQDYFPASAPSLTDYKQEFVPGDPANTKATPMVKMTAPDGRAFTLPATMLSNTSPEALQSQVNARYYDQLAQGWKSKVDAGEDITQYNAPSDKLSPRLRAEYDRALAQKGGWTPEQFNITYEKDAYGRDASWATAPNGMKFQVPNKPGADLQATAKDIMDRYGKLQEKDFYYGTDNRSNKTLSDYAQNFSSYAQDARNYLQEESKKPEFQSQIQRWADEGNVDAFKALTSVPGMTLDDIDAPEPVKRMMAKAEYNRKNKQTWSDALTASTPMSRSEEGKREMQDKLLNGATLSEIMQDPRYYDNRSIRKKLFNDVLGIGHKSPLELDKLRAGGWTDPATPLWKGDTLGEGLSNLPTQAAMKVLPGTQRMLYNIGAVPDIAKNFLLKDVGGNLASGIGRAAKGIDTITGPIGDSRTYADMTPKELGTGVADTLGGIGQGMFGALMAAPAASQGWRGAAGNIAAATGLGMTATPNADKPWHLVEKAMELGIDPDDPAFYDKYEKLLSDYYKDNGVTQTAPASPSTSSSPGSATDTQTLQSTGYLNRDSIFQPYNTISPLTSSLMSLVTPHPQMYSGGQQQGWTPNHMMNAFDEAAAGMGLNGARGYLDNARRGISGSGSMYMPLDQAWSSISQP
jgi:hypothetical protein